ncbi:MAG: hypothetical protein CVU89_08565 [Firmicutes bacterium HGW-Firmicutes-14]|nr:MAG: hypothetical protein CVU89_08565 [Firmicutes bacterium HGW-Firmicutes-14]
MSWLIPSVTATLIGTVVLALLNWHLFGQHRERYLRLWALSWTIYSLRLVFEILIQAYGDTGIFVTGHQLATLFSGLLLLCGTYEFMGKSLNRLVIIGFVFNLIWIIAGVSGDFSWHVLNLPTFWFLGAIYIWTGAVVLRSREIEGPGRRLTGWSFVLWGIHKLNYPFLKIIPWFAPWGYLIATLLEITVAAGTLLGSFDKVKRVLSASEKRFRMLAENAQDVVYRCRIKPEVRFEYISPSAKRILGYLPEEYYADPELAFRVVHPEDLPKIKDIPVLTGLNRQPMILRSFKKDGTIVWTEHHNVPVFDENGDMVGFEGIARDITAGRQAEEALKESERRFREILENVRLMTVTLDNQGNIEFCNDYLLELTGWKREELISQNWFNTIISPESRKEVRKSFMQIMRKMDGHYSLRKETTIVTKHGERRLILWNITLVYDGRGEIVGLTCFGEDISEHREAEEVFKRYQLLSAHASDIILFFRREGRIIEANEASVKMYGYTREELLNMNITDLRAPESKSLLAEKIRQAEERGILYETMHQRRDGTIFPVEVSLQGTIYGNERVLFAIIRDITERKKAEETINHLAYHDPLTDLPNRILFYDRLTVAIANARRNRKMLAVMFLDLDRFKFINDMMGHAMGDQLLKDVARELRNHVRANDTVARLGGDEFTILLPDISREEDAAVVAQKINEALKRPWELNGYEFQITASIGIVLYPNDGTDADTLTKNADTAMYRAKEQGDNYQFYTPAMNVKALEMMEMEIALRRALEQGEFQVHYQPLVDIRAGKIIGMEALVRWRHPEKGLIMPADFIPVAEETGQIIPIGESVLRTACAQNKKWQEMGYPPMRIAVNLSACQFRQKNLVATIARVLEETGMEPGFLELEITESTAMQDVDFSISTLKTLREMGIRIAMDDFGTGYSSLSYLRRFPLTTLKVDRSFVRDVLSDVEDAAIVATIIVLAQNLKLKVVIEGVENEEQLAFFEQQECFEMQGYLFSGPLPANEIDQILIKYMSLQDRNLKVL